MYLDIVTVKERKMVCNINLKKIIDYYIDDVYRISELYSNEKHSEYFIWKVLSSGKYSVYSQKLDSIIQKQNISYIKNCLVNDTPINIVLAGLPGKCANRKKVYSFLPDLGEFAMLTRFEQLNKIIKIAHKPGIKISFMSDYYGLEMTFFPEITEIMQYLDVIRSWQSLFECEYRIYPITDILPSLEYYESDFISCKISHLLNSIHDMQFDPKLIDSIRDNINIAQAKLFYEKNFNILDEDTIVKLSYIYYKMFWDYFSKKNAVHDFFGDCIYASPVAYHPEKRLCLRLQSRKARIAPWNGVGFIENKNIYSIDQRICVRKGYYEVYDNNNYFWGYSLFPTST